MPSPGFEPGSPRPQPKSDDLDRSAMGPARASNSLTLKHANMSGLDLWVIWFYMGHLLLHSTVVI